MGRQIIGLIIGIAVIGTLVALYATSV
ncbi:uncharacterized protein METZ01_LOCUS349778 [marine metagenome]|uniref:Uncharacterized protein n=1 Tax=marine metagenome TaxID=408172 RepID=A0A382RGS4_9ZZZZ